MTRTPDETELSRVKPAPADLGPLFNLLAAEATGEVSTGEAFAHLGSYDGPRPTPQPDPRIEWPAPSNARPASENAADALATPQGKVRRASQNVRILRLLAGRESGYTRDELSEATGIPIQTVCARIGHDLIARGYVEESETITRLTRSSKPAAVLFISPKGRAWLLSKQEAA